MTLPGLDIVLVNRNSGPLLMRCLRSIGAADQSTFSLQRVRVVDDCSTDDSTAVEPVGLPLEIIRNAERLGYGGSCNVGARGSRADYLLFLNTDIELERNALSAAIQHLSTAAASHVGILGIQLLELDGSIARSSSRFPTPRMMLALTLGLDRLLPAVFPPLQMTEWPHTDTRTVDQVIGAYLLIRRPLFEELGGYDERFFVYMEDLDLAVRARARGWSSEFFAGARALHLGGGTARRVWSESLFFAARSRVQYARKHFAPGGARVVALGTLLVEPWTRTGFYLLQGKLRDAAASLRAYARLWAWALTGRDNRQALT